MGFFTSPRSKKKKKAAAVAGAAALLEASSSAAAAAAPPLFLTVSDNDAQRVQHAGGGEVGAALNGNSRSRSNRRKVLKKVNSDSSLVGKRTKTTTTKDEVLLDDSSNNIQAFHQSFSVSVSNRSTGRRKNDGGRDDIFLPLSPLNNKSNSSNNNNDPIKFSPSSTGTGAGADDHDGSNSSTLDLKTPTRRKDGGNDDNEEVAVEERGNAATIVHRLSPPPLLSHTNSNDNDNDNDVAADDDVDKRKQQQQQQQQSHSPSSLASAKSAASLSSATSRNNSSNNKKKLIPLPPQGGSGGGDGVLAAPPPNTTFDESFVSYIEEFVIDEDDGRGISHLDASYDYIEEVIVEDDEEQGDDDDRRTIRVKFEEYDEVQNTIHIEDFTDKEINKYWYHRDDYDGMIQEAQVVVGKEEQRRLKQEQEQNEQSSKGGDQQQDQGASAATGKTGIVFNFNRRQSLTEFETRGLEAWSTLGKQQVRKLKEAAIDAVWDEQQRQSDIGVKDVEKIKEAYQSISVDAQRDATERGLSDQVIAERIRQLDQLGAGILGGESPHKQRLKKIKIKPSRPSLLTKSRSIFGKKTTEFSTSQDQSSRRLHLQSITRSASKRASERSQRTIYRQPSASARALMDALSNASSQDDEGESDLTGKQNHDCANDSIEVRFSIWGELFKKSGTYHTFYSLFDPSVIKMSQLFIYFSPIESKPSERRRLERSSSTKLLKNVFAVVGGHKTDGRRRRSVQSGCATWENTAGLKEGGKL